jgi:hypothetical protein
MSAPIWFDSTEAGAPVLNNAAGSLIALLRAVLINGFNVRAITSIAVAGGVATATCPNHGFSSAYGKWLQINGSPAPALNGVKQQTIIDANTFSYPAPGVADGTYTATDARRAPLGWTEVFNDGGAATRAIYRRTAPEALAPMLRVDDSGAASVARVRAVEAATGIDAFTGLSPTDAQISGGGYWQKGANSASAKRWAVFGDDRAFYLATQLGTGEGFVYYLFGDGVPYEAGDAWFTLLSTQTGAAYSATPTFGLANPLALNSAPGTSQALYASRGRLPSSLSSELSGVSGVNVGTLWGNASAQSEATHPMVAISNNVLVHAAGYVRGEAPGMAVPLANFTAKAALTEVVAGAHRYVALPYNHAGTSGCVLIRVSGDWYA